LIDWETDGKSGPNPEYFLGKWAAVQKPREELVVIVVVYSVFTLFSLFCCWNSIALSTDRHSFVDRLPVYFL